MINSYEIDGHIVTDLMAYDDATILEKWDLNAMRNNIYDERNQAQPTRFIMPLSVNLNEVIDYVPCVSTFVYKKSNYIVE